MKTLRLVAETVNGISQIMARFAGVTKTARSFARFDAALRRNSAHERVDQPTGQRDDDDRRQWIICRRRLGGAPSKGNLWAGKLRLDSHAQGSLFEGLEELRSLHAPNLRRERNGGHWEGSQVEGRGKY